AQLPFWIERLGFSKTAEVPHGGAIGFAILQLGDAEVMLQSRASVADDIAALSAEPWRSALYVEIEDLERTKRALGDVPRFLEERTTFYGMREIGVRDPAGNAVILAQRASG
ncbi:MAG TPA: VOC family protein, partial [Planctomycetota bacterium]|nr:VOC family protein [Planctomycetota bacterium]